MSSLSRKHLRKGIVMICSFLAFAVLYSVAIRHFFGSEDPADTKKDTFEEEIDEQTGNYKKPYLEFLEKVYREMEENYYKPVSKETYNEFRAEYKEKILPQAKESPERIDQIAHMGAGIMVTRLRDEEDTFTNFIPPKEAEKYKEEIYSYESAIGIEGVKMNDVFVINHVEIRSPAYKEGIRVNDILLAIENIGIAELSEEEISALLRPPLEHELHLVVAKVEDQELKEYRITSEEYFTEALFKIPTPVEGVLYLKIDAFNKKTEEDLRRNLISYGLDNIRFLILDVRDNPGGPPLAVRSIASIFIGPGQNLFYYKKKNVPEFGLVSPEEDLFYTGPMAVVVNEKSGSASELLAGTLQEYNRAVIAGKSNTAGFAFLKGVSDFEDGSALAMITGWAYLFTGEELGKEGIRPDIIIPDEIENVPAFVVNQVRLSIEE